jgi:hypothetical protein
MTIEQKSKVIWNIIRVLKNQAICENRSFDVGDVFLSLVFRTDEQLTKLAALCGLDVNL